MDSDFPIISLISQNENLVESDDIYFGECEVFVFSLFRNLRKSFTKYIPPIKTKIY